MGYVRVITEAQNLDRQLDAIKKHEVDHIYNEKMTGTKKENIQCIVDTLQVMQMAMREIAGQIQSGNFYLSDESYVELKRDYLALVVTVVDIVNGGA